MHVPGVETVEADALSRMDEVGDYELKQELFEAATRGLRVQPTIDLFANNKNMKCSSFLALPGKDGLGAADLDAFRFQ
jgi:hypothetical protein